MKQVLFWLCISCTALGFSQKKLSKLLKKHNDKKVPYITVNALKDIKNEVILLDSREKKEYNVSHLKNAIYVGYDVFNIDSVTTKLPKKDSNIVVYCSLGIRSEDIAQQLKKAGYTNVLNLYGGIFEWKNNDLEVVNLKEQPTDSVHAFSEEWSKWLNKGTKVYE